METIRKIRCAYRNGKSIKQISRDYHLSRNVVRKVLRGEATEFTYERTSQPMPKLGHYEDSLLARLKEDANRPKREQRTAKHIFYELQSEGFTGGYDSVRRYIGKWRKNTSGDQPVAYIPQIFDPGEAYQFDWSEETVELGGVAARVSVAHFRLCHSRMFFCRAYNRESLEMVLDAHVRAFEYFGGSCKRGIYDNLKTVVTKVLMGKDRNFNKRFIQLASHYLIEPVACTPAAGWEKGQVENQVKTMRQWLFTPRLKFSDISELNAWLSDRCRILAAGNRHPEFKDKTIAAVYEEEKVKLVNVGISFDGFRENPVHVSSTCLVSFDRNRYSVDASCAGRSAMLRAYANRVVIVGAGVVIGEHERRFDHDHVIYNPMHYVSVLQRKPGALRNGAPFKDWELPEPVQAAREALRTRPDGDKQFVGILGMIPMYGLEAVTAACSEALSLNAPSRDVLLNILSRASDETEITDCSPPGHLPELASPPIADCGRYDILLSGGGRNAQR